MRAHLHIKFEIAECPHRVLSPYPFAANLAEFALAGRYIESRQHEKRGGWPAVLKETPTEWERFRSVAT